MGLETVITMSANGRRGRRKRIYMTDDMKMSTDTRERHPYLVVGHLMRWDNSNHLLKCHDGVACVNGCGFVY